MRVCAVVCACDSFSLAALLDVAFCEQFERLYTAFFPQQARSLPPAVRELRAWAADHHHKGGAGGVSDMTFYFLLQRRADAWADKTLGWLSDVGDLGAHWSESTDPAATAATATTSFAATATSCPATAGVDDLPLGKTISSAKR